MSVPVPGRRSATTWTGTADRVLRVWDPSAWVDCKHWQTADRKVRKRTTTLIDARLRDPVVGIGTPEQLTYGALGAFSRRITEEHRLVHLVDGDDLVILHVRYHD